MRPYIFLILCSVEQLHVFTVHVCLKCQEPLPANMQISMCAYLIRRRVTLAKWSQDLIDPIPCIAPQEAVLTKKNTCYNCIITVAMQNSGTI